MNSELKAEQEGFPQEALTLRETEILGLYAAGFNNPEIAEKLFLAESTIKWYARQIFDKLCVKSRKAAVTKALSLGLLEAKEAYENLPAALTPLIGRMDELRSVERSLLDPGCRFLTICGPGGIGKTRLALQAATNLAAQRPREFRDGINFVRPEPISNPISALADSLQLQSFQGSENTRSQLLVFLKRQHRLIVLDNFEIFVGTSDAAWLIELLTNAACVKLLVTSRIRLNLPGEQTYILDGLDVPDGDAFTTGVSAVEQIASYSSVQLFLQAARRTHPSFHLSEENVIPVRQIVRLLEGIPLGIELAAGWIGVLSPQEIQAEVEKSLDFLQSPLQGIPDRHKSLRAVFAASWRLLEEHGREAAKRLAVFQGGFDYQAAKDISGLSPQELMTLVNKSWIQLERSGRYRFYDTSRVFVEEVARQEGIWEAVCEDHSRYFCEIAAVQGSQLRSFGHKEALDRFRVDLDNMRAAWYWAVSRCRVALLEQAISGLCRYFYLYGRPGEGAELCAAAVEALTENSLEKADRLLAHLLIWQSMFTSDRDRIELLLVRAEKNLDRGFDRLDPSWKSVQAFLWHQKGELAVWRDRKKAQSLFRKSLALYQELGQEQNVAELMNVLGWMSWSTGELETARKWLEESLVINQRYGYAYFAAKNMNLLGAVERDLGNPLEGERLQRKSVEMFRSLESHRGLADALIIYPFTLMCSGKIEEAEQRAHESVAEYERMGYEGPYLAKPYSVLCSVLTNRGHYRRARVAGQKGLNIARRYASQQDIGHALHFLGILDLLDGEHKLAEEHFSESLRSLAGLDHKRAAVPLAYLAYLSSLQGDEEQAGKYITQAITETLKSGDVVLGEEVLEPTILYLESVGYGDKAAEIFASIQLDPNHDRWFIELCGEDLVRRGQLLLQEAAKKETEVEPAQGVRDRLKELLDFFQ